MSYAIGSGAASATASGSGANNTAASGSSSGAAAAATGAAAASATGGAAAAGLSALVGMQVPKSCIESAETILRTLNNPAYKFTQGFMPSSAAAPPMFLWIKNGLNSISINVSDSTSEQIFAAAEGKNSYRPEGFKLNTLPPGQGICFIRVKAVAKGVAAGDYDMHFMALVAIKGDTAILSNVSMSPKWKGKGQVPLADNLVAAKTIAGLRAAFGSGSGFTKWSEFASGVISLDGKTPP